MLSAFTARPIVELKQRDKSKIEAILAYGDRILVGLSTGVLRVYRVNEAPAEEPTRADGAAQPSENGSAQSKQKKAELLREQEKFSKQKIDQLAIIKEANILVSLSNTYVSIHDIQNYELQEQLTKTKGASTFAVTSNILKDPSTGVPSIVSRLAVAVKRRLLLWSWHDMELAENATEIALASSIKSLTWATGTKVVAGLSSSYVMVDVETEEVKAIIGPGSIGGTPGQDSGRLGGVGVSTMTYMGYGSMIPEPLATALGEGEMLLAKDINTHFINRDGEPLGRRQIPWRAAPQAIGYSYPYLLALQEASKGTLEVRNPVTLSLLQSISLSGANLLQVAQPNISLAHAGKGFLVASERTIWRMGALDYDSQINALVAKEHLDEAISLLEMLEDALVTDKEGRLRDIKMQKAQLLFDAKRFRESLDLFAEVAAPPERVIKLYPEIISGGLTSSNKQSLRGQEQSSPDSKGQKAAHSTTEDYKTAENPSPAAVKKVQSDGEKETSSTHPTADPAPTTMRLSDTELKAAVRELQAFLADVRRRLQRFFNPDQSLKDEATLQEDDHYEDLDQMLRHLLDLSSLDDVDRGQKLIETAKLVDTTLFRAHMYATPSLATSLFRIANFCDPEVVMDKLEETHRHGDLIEFLFGKRLHRQALERLKKFGQSEDEEENQILRGPGRTVGYLQSLPPELIDLILEFARWPMEANPDMGMEIFLADTENAENLPRPKVVAFLEGINEDLAVRYLEHVIDELNDQTPDMHQKLLTLYFEELQSWSKSEAEMEEIQSKFQTLLKSSNRYSPAKILAMLPRDSPTFYESRAIVFSKMGQHKQALEIYVFKLHETTRAEEYCNRVYLTEDAVATKLPPSRRRSTTDPVEEQPTIYHTLLNLYLNPPKGEKALWGPAIELLARHGARLPASSTLELIPEMLPVKELEFYFRGRIRSANNIVNESGILAGLRKVEAVRVQAGLLLGEDDRGNRGRNRKVKVDEERVCPVCYKRLGGSVISVFPDNSVVHLGCASRKQAGAARA